MININIPNLPLAITIVFILIYIIWTLYHEEIKEFVKKLFDILWYQYIFPKFKNKVKNREKIKKFIFWKAGRCSNIKILGIKGFNIGMKDGKKMDLLSALIDERYIEKWHSHVPQKIKISFLVCSPQTSRKRAEELGRVGDAIDNFQKDQENLIQKIIQMKNNPMIYEEADIEVKTIDYLPTFGLLIIDDVAIVYYYPRGSKSNTTPHFVYSSKTNENIYNMIQNVFNTLWRSGNNVREDNNENK